MHAAARWSTMLLVVAILASCIGCDQLTKQMAREALRDQGIQSFCGDTFRLVYAENAGAFLGLGSGLPESARWAILVVFNALVAGVIVFVLWRRTMSFWHVVAGALVLAGAIGNLIDRLRFDGLVTDFMNLGVGPLRTGIFNVADVAISTGAVLWALLLVRAERANESPRTSRLD